MRGFLIIMKIIFKKNQFMVLHFANDNLLDFVVRCAKQMKLDHKLNQIIKCEKHISLQNE